MPRWSVYGQGETQVLTEGDRRFNGLDMTRDRALLEPGILAVSQNKRLNNGIAATRGGCMVEPDFNPRFTNQLVGSGLFSNPNGDEVLMVGERNASFVWSLQFGKDPDQIPIVTGTLNSSNETGILDCTRVRFVQAFDHVYCLRSPSTRHSTLIWDGTSSANGGVFTPVTQQETPPTGDIVIPGGVDPANTFQVIRDPNNPGQPFFCPWNGEPFQDRILFYNDNDPDPNWRDTFLMTETELWDLYNPASGTWRVNSGESNILTRVMSYYRGGVLVFFKRGIHIVENFTNPPPAPTGNVGAQRMINSFLGAVSYDAIQEVGVDVYFLSEPGKGVYRVSEAVQDQIAVNPLAVSDAIQPVMDLINWQQAAHWASIKSVGPYLFLGIPVNPTVLQIAGSGNNMIVVYNQYTRQWESTDTFDDPKFSFQQMHVISCNGIRQLFTVDWYRKLIVGMYYGSVTDNIGPLGLARPINDVIETRGYTLGDPTGFKRYQRTCLAIRTFDPQIDLTSISDGYNESKLLNDRPIIKDRLRYYIHGQEFFDPDTDDPEAPKRQDYSPETPNYAIEDFEDLPVGSISVFGGTNQTILFNEKKQQTLERYQIRQNGRWASIRVDNSRGSCDVLAVSVDGIPVQEGVHLVA